MRLHNTVTVLSNKRGSKNCCIVAFGGKPNKFFITAVEVVLGTNTSVRNKIFSNTFNFLLQTGLEILSTDCSSL